MATKIISMGIATTLSVKSMNKAEFIPSDRTQCNLQRLLTLLFIATLVVNGVGFGAPEVLSSKMLACLNMALFTIPVLLVFKGIVDGCLVADEKTHTDLLVHIVYFLALGALIAMNALYLMGSFDQPAIAYSAMVAAGALTLFHGAKVYGWYRINQAEEKLNQVEKADHYPFGIANSGFLKALLTHFSNKQEMRLFVRDQSYRQFLMTLLFIATVVVNALHFTSPDLLSSDLLTYSNIGLLALPACVVFKGIWDTPSNVREERVLHAIYFLALGALIAMNALYLFGYFNHEAIAYSTLAAAGVLTVFHGMTACDQMLSSCPDVKTRR